MHHVEEIQKGVEAIRESGNDQVILLHCVSNYPPAPENLNLRNIQMLRQTFGLPVGFSDHSRDNRAIPAAVALGACLVEKHITLDRTAAGPDHFFALDPQGMEDLVSRIRGTEKMMGSYRRILSEEELEARAVARRSIVARLPIKKGEELTSGNLKLSRPGSGLHPRHLEELLGKKARVDIGKEELIKREDLE
jgi:N-acetylneuraminate synthase/N,N'-diacetyllegionaminate synthase